MLTFADFSYRFRTLPTPMGDLALAMMTDPDFPKEETEWLPILHHLKEARASDRMLHAAKSMYKLYKKEVRKIEREQPVCNG